jgi:hypothetical protein
VLGAGRNRATYADRGICDHDGVATETHLQMIQAVISRLAGQSTTIKGWCVTVTGALLGFGASSATPIIAIIAIYVICAFAALDAYFLTLERGYRILYQQACDDQTSPWLLAISRPTTKQVATALISPAIVILYGTSLLVAISIGIYLVQK